MSLEQCLAYFRTAVQDPRSTVPWSEWWAENEMVAANAFSIVDYVRLKHRRLLGARQILQLRGELPKEFVPPSASVTGSCEKCGERVVEQMTEEGLRLVCPLCQA